MSRREVGVSGNFLFGFLVIGAVFGGLIGWSVFAPFEGAVVASGQVSVESNQKAVQHLEGGIVSAIHVREGDRVQAGMPLIELSGTATRAQLSALENRLASLAAREARLQAEINDESELDVRAALRGLPELTDALKAQNALMLARLEARRNTQNILRSRIDQLDTSLVGLRKQVEANQREAEFIQSEISDLEGLLAEGLASRTRVLELKRNFSRLSGARASLESEIATTKVRIGETRIELQRLESDFREEAMTELREVSSTIDELLEERVAAQDRLDRLVIDAPSEGYVIGVRAHTVGGVINPAEPVMFIVPENEALVATLRVRPADIDKVTPGQPARLRFSAFSQRETPEIEAEVLKVSADAIRDESSGAMFYEAIVSIPPDSPVIRSLGIRPGMPVEAMLRTESRSVISYLIKPLTDSAKRTFRE